MKPVGKKETLLAFLERGIAMLHLDARRPGVAVPSAHADDPHLRINLSYRFGIPDLLIDDARVRATLSFGGRPFQCQIPWSAVFGITSQTTGDGQVWPEDLPTEVMSNLAAQEKQQGAEKLGPKQKKPSRPALVAVKSDSDDLDDEPVAPRGAASEKLVEVVKSEEKREPPPDGPPKKGHLRLIR